MSEAMDYMPAKRKSPSRASFMDGHNDGANRHRVLFTYAKMIESPGFGALDFTPTQGTAGAAAFDLKSSTCRILCPKETAKIPVGICMEIPDGLYAEIKGRSGLAAKAIMCHNGVIDSDYRGEVCVILYNASEETFDIKRGDRVAQMVFHRVEYVQFERVKKLTETERGEGGFGSTGM